MEDDGTVNMKKGPQQQRQPRRGKEQQQQQTTDDEDEEGVIVGSSSSSSNSSTSDDTTSTAVSTDEGKGESITAREGTARSGSNGSPSLAQLLGKPREGEGTKVNDVTPWEEKRSVDLKELLPKQKMKFMKLDVSIM